MSLSVTISSNPPGVQVSPASVNTVQIENRNQSVTVLIDRPIVSVASVGISGAGQPGPAGAAGLSAYQIAVDNGFVGNEASWLLSLKGENATLNPVGYLVVGHNNGSGLPDVVTQAKIDALVAAGVSIFDIVWAELSLVNSSIVLPTITVNPVFGGLTITGILVAEIIMSAFTATPTITPMTLAGIRVGAFTMPQASISPILSTPVLTGVAAGTGLMILPPFLVTPTFTAMTLAGVQTGAFSMSGMNIEPSFVTSTLTGIVVGTGVMVLPTIMVTPTFDPQTLAGIQLGAFTMPGATIALTFVAPQITGSVIIINSFTSNITPFAAGAGNAGSFSIASNEGVVDAASVGYVNYLAAIVSQAAPFSVKADVKFTNATSGNIRLCALKNSDGYNWSAFPNIIGYHLLLSPDTGAIVIRKNLNTVVATLAHTFDTSYHNYKLTIAANGDMAVLRDGVSILAANDTTHQNGFITAAIAAGYGLMDIKNYIFDRP